MSTSSPPATVEAAPRRGRRVDGIGVLGRTARGRTTDGLPALIVDGLFGVGLSRPPGGPYAEWIDWANAGTAPILALDVPSGLDAGTGVAHAPTIRATATATFIALKPGLLTLDGPDHCGETVGPPAGHRRRSSPHRRAHRVAATAA
jgi:NAD(P)H-hydrate repair Nnr-like enzyme with NAD(P)H-hydrate epimerase domain